MQSLNRNRKALFVSRVSTLAITLALLLPAIQLWSAEPPQARNSAISRHMKAIGKNLSELSTLVGDAAERKKVLKLVTDMQKKMMLVKIQTPAIAKEGSKEEQAQVKTEFRITANRMLRELIELEIEILEDRSEAAADRIGGSLKELMQEAHGKFR